MAPRKAAASSSSSKQPPLPSTAAKKVNAATRNESSAAGKKRKAAAPPSLPAAPPPAPTTVYVLMKSEGYAPDGFHSYQAPTNSIEGVYYSEDQAYAAAIRKLISGYGSHSEDPELRKLATDKGLPLKERMKKVRVTAIRSFGVEEAKFRVKKTQLFPAENVDDGRLLDGIKPTESPRSDSDYQSDGAASSSSSDGLSHRNVAL